MLDQQRAQAIYQLFGALARLRLVGTTSRFSVSQEA